MIFETERLLIRNLKLSDLNAFHEMESNPKVLQFADGVVKSIGDHLIELKELISSYNNPKNDFWIFAIENKSNQLFIGTVALVKDENDDEIGYRFLEKYWNLGFGSEVCKGIILYCKKKGMKKIIGYVVDENRASAKILEKYNFKIIDQFLNDDNQQETKYELVIN
jgi:RimJ/RimL family protein N-acetyltransferase